MTMSRRSLLWSASALGLTLLLPRSRIRAAADGKKRFLLHVFAQGGLDTTMLFDARPLAMTAAGKIHNPLGEEPVVWTGTNGQSSLAASPSAPLHAVRERFSVINGVVMSTSFDGHAQNTNLFLAGNPFGGTSFNAELNVDASTPLDYVRLGDVVAALQDSRTIRFSPAGVKELVAGVGAVDGLSPALDDFLAGEAAALGDPAQRFGAGALALDAATTASKDLQARIKAIQLADEPDPLDAQLALAREVFRLDIARGVMFGIVGPGDPGFDNHAAQSAKVQGPSYVELSTRLARILRYLADTPYDASSSLLDVTTVVVGSEFGRTMRQTFAPIDDTGTDHNPLSSSVLIGGAGIRGGLVVGASDFQSADETLSGAHTALDRDSVKTMGRPFDFATGLPRTDLPAAFAPTDYLQIASVINTVYSVFDVPRDRWRVTERNGGPAPVLSTLLA